MIYHLNPNTRHHTDFQDMETQPSPSLVSVKQSDLRIIIDEFPEDLSEPTSPVKPVKDPVYFINKMMEEIKLVSRSTYINL